jgi:signal transduction histidine kinase
VSVAVGKLKVRKLSSLVKRLFEVQEQLELGLQIQDSSSKIMKSLVGDLLDFAQLSNGKFRKVEEQFNIRQTINEVIKIMDYKAMKKGVNIRTIFQNFDDEMLIDENPSSSIFNN